MLPASVYPLRFPGRNLPPPEGTSPSYERVADKRSLQRWRRTTAEAVIKMKSGKCEGEISGRTAVTQQSYAVGVERIEKERIRSERQGPVGLEKCDSIALRGPQHSLDPPATKRILLKTIFFVNACLR
jgi:hypothetical protein